MSELKIRTESTGTPAAPVERAAPGAVGPDGPGNNWGQVPSPTEVTAKPPNYDSSRPADAAAPLGYLDDGRPWSPYGCTAGGKIRRVPRPAAAARDPNRPTAPGDGAAHRLAPGEQKAAADVKALYAAYEDAKKRQAEIGARIQKEHPGTQIAERVRDQPAIGGAVIEGFLKTATAFLAEKLEDPDARPTDKAITEAATSIREASRYYGIDTSNKAMATWAAVVSVFVCFLPAILSGLNKLLGKKPEKKTEKKAMEEAA